MGTRVLLCSSLLALFGCTTNANNGTLNLNDGSHGPVTKPFGDPQVAGLSLTIHDDAIEVGMAALTRVVMPQTRALAQRMIDDHTAARDQMLAVVQAANITPDRGTTEVKALLYDTEEPMYGDVGLVLGASGLLADKWYVGDGGVEHDAQKAVEIHDHTLLPSVMNADLRARVESDRQLLVDEIAVAHAVLVTIGTTLE
jgi:hypothetical protein